MIPASAALSFWSAVEDCLVEFHNWNPKEAAFQVSELRKKLQRTQCERSSFDDLIYHQEPWRLACDISGQQLSLDGYVTAYENVLRQNHLA